MAIVSYPAKTYTNKRRAYPVWTGEISPPSVIMVIE